MTIAVHASLPPIASEETRARPCAVAIWLLVICVLVTAMILVGGATRLTDSGLSITEWRPVTGAIPPIGEAAWQAELEKYRQIPEYQRVNKGMTLAEFQFIYWWEWGHRFLGRIVGVAFALPLMWFWARGAIPTGLKPRLLLLFGMGGLQGLIGWWMVSSGLVERVDVSQYRLATHLGMAFAILGIAFWTALGLLQRRGASAAMTGWATAFSGLVFAQIILGAFVAGLDAGLIYNDWPWMNGRLVPDGLYGLAPAWLSAFEDVGTVQFNHRVAAYGLALAGGLLVAAVVRRVARARGAAMLVGAALAAQLAIGVITLMKVAPLSWSLAHQAGGVTLFLTAIHLMHALRRA